MTGGRFLLFKHLTLGKIPTDPDRPRMRQPHRPERSARGKRVAPQLQALRDALASEKTRLSDTTDEAEPDHVVVFETIGALANFVRAAQEIQGFDFISDFVGDGIAPDEDFYYLDDEGDPSEKQLPQSLYLVMANATAIDQLIGLFNQFQEDESITLPTGMYGLKELFKCLHTVRRWGPEDRIRETGLLEAWRDDIDFHGPNGTVSVEVELVWRETAEARGATVGSALAVLEAIEGATVLSAAVVEAIKYHALLVELSRSKVEQMIHQDPNTIELLQVEDIIFLSPAAQMNVTLSPGSPTSILVAHAPKPTGKPKIAVLDGLPLTNHDALSGRIQVDDPEDRTSSYTLAEQYAHGTAMASLIIHGDLANPGPPLSSPLHFHPVFEGHEWGEAATAPPGALFVDVVHAAFQHLVGVNAATPSVRIVNFSIGDSSRVFVRRVSPLARLLDYFAVEYNLVIIVSAGNHPHITPTVPAEALADAGDLDIATRQSLHRQARLRRLLSPAEAINAVTVGALHTDSTGTIQLPDSVLDPLQDGSIAAYSPHGFGFRKSPKPDVHAPGGRAIYARPVAEDGSDNVTLDPVDAPTIGPGLLVAAPSPLGSTNGARFTSGTSNAAALTTRSAHHILEMLESTRPTEAAPKFPDPQYHPVLVKTLLIHAAMWPQDANEWAAQLGANGATRRRLLTSQLGFGSIVASRLGSAAPHRACLVGAGTIRKDKRDSFRLPLPPSLSTVVGWRRLTITLAWLSPTMPTTQQYRVAHLEFGSPGEDLRIKARQADHNANGRGTVLHEVMEGTAPAGYAHDHQLAIDVDCRVRVGKLPLGVRYGLAATLEVDPSMGIDIHTEIRQRIRIQAAQRTTQVQPRN